MEEIETLRVGLEVTSEQYANDLQDAQRSTDSFIGNVTTGMGGLGAVLTGLGIGGLFAGIGTAAFGVASDLESATALMQTQLGLTATEAESLGDVVTNVFGDNFGTDMGDAAQAVSDVRMQMRGLADEELEAVTKQALGLESAFGKEVPESVSTANTLMEEFGLSSEQAFDFITYGLQNNLDASGDFFDTIGEYSNQFSDAGYSAEEFFSIMQSGQGGGMLGTDKIADSVKEANIRIKELNDDVIQSFTDIGDLSFADDFAASIGLADSGMIDFSKHSEEVSDYFEKEFGLKLDPDVLTTPLMVWDEESGAFIEKARTFEETFSSTVAYGIEDGTLSIADAQKIALKGLQDVDNQVHQNSIGVRLFGTQWEDMTASGILSMDPALTSLDQMAGATDTLNAQYQTTGDMFRGVWRMVQTDILLPIGDKLLEMGNTILPYLASGIEGIGALLSGDASLGQFAANIGTWVSDAIPVLVSWLGNAFDAMVTWVESSLPGWIETLELFALELGVWIVNALPPMIDNLYTVLQGMIDWVVDSLPGWVDALLGFAEGLLTWVLDALPGFIENLGKVYSGMITWIIDSLPGWGEKLGELGAKLWGWVVDILPTLGTKLGDVAAAMFTWLGTLIVDVGPKLLDLAGKFLGWVTFDVLPALPGLLLDIGAAILTAIGNFIVEVAPGLLELAGSFLNWVTEDVLPLIPEKLGLLWDAISTWITDTAGKAWEAAASIGANIADGITGAIKNGLGSMYNWIVGIINPIIDGINSVIEGLNYITPGEGFDLIPHMPMLAEGTNWWQGGPAIAGEEGMELMTHGNQAALLTGGMYSLPQGAKVLDAGRTANALGGGGTTIVQNFQSGTPEDWKRQMKQALKEALDAEGRKADIRQKTR